jgi:hypothetical protein
MFRRNLPIFFFFCRVVMHHRAVKINFRKTANRRIAWRMVTFGTEPTSTTIAGITVHGMLEESADSPDQRYATLVFVDNRMGGRRPKGVSEH